MNLCVCEVTTNPPEGHQNRIFKKISKLPSYRSVQCFKIIASTYKACFSFVRRIGSMDSASPKTPAKPLGWSEKITAVWYLLDAFTHLSIEQIYCILTFFYNGARNLPNSPFSEIWIEYGKADKRWAEYDPTVLSLELLTVYIMGPLALLGLYGVSRQRATAGTCCWTTTTTFRGFIPLALTSMLLCRRLHASRGAM